MIFLRVVRFVRGEVAFSVSGGQTERFLNLCAAQGIPLWCGRREPGGYRGRTSLSASRFLPALAEKAGVTLRISGRLGIPCILLRYRRRGALLAGAAVLLAALLVMSGFIWKIEVDGCEEIDAGEVLAALMPGVEPGFPAAVSVHSERITLSTVPRPGYTLRGRVTQRRYTGSTVRAEVTLSHGMTMTVQAMGALSALPEPGTTVYPWWLPESATSIPGRA